MLTEPRTLSDLLGKPDFMPQKRLEGEVERVLLSHLTRRERKGFPITTDDLTTLIEEHVSELDLYADLSEYGDVEGATFFLPGLKPIVRITAELSSTKSENRLRSTLAHEFGHVLLHDPMYQRRAQQGLFELDDSILQVSFRDGFTGSTDLFEFQAWTVCGALLMPFTELSRVVGGMAVAAAHYGSICIHSELGSRIHTFSARHFSVSMDLARVRLLRSGVMTDKEPPLALF